MYRSVLVRALLAVAMTALSGAYANAQPFQALFSGLNEVPPILSQAQGTLKMTLNTQAQSLTYTLTFSGFTSPASASHIHFARARDNGAVIVFLCGGGGKPACPSLSGTVSGTITAADVLGVPAQGITAGDFTALTTALVSQAAYANIHTTNFPAGEIRGEIIPCPGSGCP